MNTIELSRLFYPVNSVSGEISELIFDQVNTRLIHNNFKCRSIEKLTRKKNVQKKQGYRTKKLGFFTSFDSLDKALSKASSLPDNLDEDNIIP